MVSHHAHAFQNDLVKSSIHNRRMRAVPPTPWADTPSAQMRTERARSVAHHALKGALPVLYGKRPLHAVRVRGSVISIAVDRAAALLQNRTEEVVVRHRLLEARHERRIRLLGLKAAEQTAQAPRCCRRGPVASSSRAARPRPAPVPQGAWRARSRARPPSCGRRPGGRMSTR